MNIPTNIRIIENAYGKVRGDRFGVVVEIFYKENCFKFMPTYKDLATIYALLAQVEAMNKNLQLNTEQK